MKTIIIAITWVGLVLASTSAAAMNASSSCTEQTAMWENFVTGPTGYFQWCHDPKRNLLNFRKCHRHGTNIHCLYPILSRGLDASEYNSFFRYYLERLSVSGGHKTQQLIGVGAGSLVGLSAYLSTANLVRTLIPENWNPVILHGSYHVLTAGALLTVIYYIWALARSRLRQNLIARDLSIALSMNNAEFPVIHFSSSALYREFAESFRKTLYEYTHGGGYDLTDNMIVQ